MTGQGTTKIPLPGLGKFGGAAATKVEDPRPLTDADINKLHEVNQAHGIEVKQPPAAAPAKARPVVFDDRVNIRVQKRDRLRFEDFAHKFKLSKGDAFRRLMDLAEAADVQSET